MVLSPRVREIVASRRAREEGAQQRPKAITGAARRNEDTGDGRSRQGRLAGATPAPKVATVDFTDGEPRRLNPAITYLYERGILVNFEALGVPQFAMVRVVGKEDEIRRFLKSRI